jgi:YjbE family integral membrane protein
MPTEYTSLIDNLIAIIVIDLILAGDNAILIALATQKLDSTIQKRAILWGSIAAIVIRTFMTIIAVQLLKVPALSAIGGLALLVIAYRLITDHDEGHEQTSKSTFWGAMRTIIIADAVMGIDNVLAVAGASEGHMGLVVIGLLISVPIVMFGSTLILKLLEKFNWLIFVGGAVLIITGVKMITHEKLLAELFDDSHPYNEWILLGICLVTILGIGWKISKQYNANQSQG